MERRIRVFAPATVANLGPGFDVLGLALSRPGDLIEAELSDRPGVDIVEITGDGGQLSTDASKNVAGRAATDVLRRASQATGSGGRVGVRLWLHKQMPLASGLGSSGASSAAAAVAVNELLGQPFSQRDLVVSAMEGERAATRMPHADNVAPSLLGGIVLVRSYDPLEIVSLPVPDRLRVVVVHPDWKVSTAEARRLVGERRFSITDIVSNLGNIAALVASLNSGDLSLLGRSIHDRLVEPLRAPLIPGFDAVKKAALAAGALGCSIAGSGPSIFAFAADKESEDQIGIAMQTAFAVAAGLASEVYAGRVSVEGTRVLKDGVITKERDAGAGRAALD